MYAVAYWRDYCSKQTVSTHHQQMPITAQQITHEETNTEIRVEKPADNRYVYRLIVVI